MNLRQASYLLAALTATSLASCSASIPPLIEKPKLPDAPADFGKPVALPGVKKGESIKVFSLQNRAAAIEANQRLKNDASFYNDVVKDFSRSP